MPTSSDLDLAGQLRDLDDHKLRRLERCKPDQDVDDSQIDVVLCGRLLVALEQVRLQRRLALKCALAKEVVHESSDVQPNLRPQRLIVRLEDHPFGASEEALLDEQRDPTYRNVFPLAGHGVGANQSPRAPSDV